MSTAGQVFRWQASNVLRSRWLLGYAGFHLVMSDALLRFGGDPAAALLSLVNVVLLLIPLVATVFGTVFLYDAREFTELLLAQPVSRRSLFAGLYGGLAVPLAAAFVVGVGLPMLGHAGRDPRLGGTLLALLAIGAVLTLVFTAMAFLVALRSEDRVRGLGTAVGIWLGFAVVYDGVVLLAASVFADWPLERALLGAMIANPVDMARVILLLRFDVAALMGYTGAVFERFFGAAAGIGIAAAALIAWAVAPTWGALRTFDRKDF